MAGQKTVKRGELSDRKHQILQNAVDMVASEGYARLSMRALARASGMKLGALQYHFPTWEALLRSLADHIRAEYRASFPGEDHPGQGAPDLRDVVGFFLDDAAGERLHSDRLWPQLWAMAQVEPVMGELLGEIYGSYLRALEDALVARGNEAPRAEALSLMSLIEGSALFVGRGARWAGDAETMRDRVLETLDHKYGRG